MITGWIRGRYGGGPAVDSMGALADLTVDLVGRLPTRSWRPASAYRVYWWPGEPGG
jgi:hypothetical protein